MKKYVILCAMVLASFQVKANSLPTELGVYGDWTAYSYKEGKNTVCYMASTPKKDEGNYKKRGDIYAVVTHRPADKTYNVVNFVAGYDYKKNSNSTTFLPAETMLGHLMPKRIRNSLMQ